MNEIGFDISYTKQDVLDFCLELDENSQQDENEPNTFIVDIGGVFANSYGFFRFDIANNTELFLSEICFYGLFGFSKKGALKYYSNVLRANSETVFTVDRIKKLIHMHELLG